MIALPTLPRIKMQNALRPITLRDFGGGWDVIDDDMNMAHKFAKKSYNIFTQPDGVAQVRYGTVLFADLRSHFVIGEVKLSTLNTLLTALLLCHQSAIFTVSSPMEATHSLSLACGTRLSLCRLRSSTVISFCVTAQINHWT
jgi:hypothetical protein